MARKILGYFLKAIGRSYFKINLAYVLGIQLVQLLDSCVCVSLEDIPDSPSSPGSSKIALLPPVLKKVPSDKERDGQISPQPSPRTLSQEGKKCFLSVSFLQGESFQEKGINPGLDEYPRV